MFVSAVNRVSEGLVKTEVHLNCVYSPDPKTEEHSFWKASPNGQLKLTYWGELPFDFRPGQKFYVDVTRGLAADAMTSELRGIGFEIGRPYVDGKIVDDPKITRIKVDLYGKGAEHPDLPNQVYDYWSMKMDIDNDRVFEFYSIDELTYSLKLSLVEGS